MEQKMKQNCPFLLVEDDKIDAMTVKRAMSEINIKNELHIVDNGEKALEYLLNNGNKRPCLILLDLNMPKMNGIEFLNIIKNDTSLKTIPVVVITTSNEEQDKLESFRLGIAGYMLKPVDYGEFVKVMKTIDQYWRLSECPEGDC